MFYEYTFIFIGKFFLSEERSQRLLLGTALSSLSRNPVWVPPSCKVLSHYAGGCGGLGVGGNLGLGRSEVKKIGT